MDQINVETMNFKFPLVVMDGDDTEIIGHARSKVELLSLVKSLDEESNVVLHAYLDELPYALVKREIHDKLEKGVDCKFTQASNNRNVTALQCTARAPFSFSAW